MRICQSEEVADDLDVGARGMCHAASHMVPAWQHVAAAPVARRPEAVHAGPADHIGQRQTGHDARR